MSARAFYKNTFDNRWVVHFEPLGGDNFYVEDEWTARRTAEFVNQLIDRIPL